MPLCEIAFWGCALLVLYPYVLYPLLLAILVRLRGRPVRRTPLPATGRPSVSFLVAAHNEEGSIERRLTELLALLETTGVQGEVLLACDGCSDGTAAVARRLGDRGVQVIELPQRGGKAVALSRAAAAARFDVLVFADVRQTWAADALERLLENFADPQVGAVSGDLEVRATCGTLEGVSLYWRYEKWLRRQESGLWAQVGVTGAISACRRTLFPTIPAGTLLDDVYWPLHVAMRGYRVIHDSRARAHDRLPERSRDEFRRKVRTLAGNYQLACRLPAALLPWRNPIWAQLLSHKLARLLVPWALLGLLGCSLALTVGGAGDLYTAALAAQAACYGVGFLGLLGGRVGRVGAAASSFLVLNAAAWVAFWVWATGRARQSWQKVQYGPSGWVVPAGDRHPAASS